MGGYDKGNKATSQTPVIPDEKKVRRYGQEVDRLLNVIKAHNTEIESLQSEKSGIKNVLQEIYDKHKVEVANLYIELNQKKNAFEMECQSHRKRMLDIQIKLDEQATGLETTAISIEDDKKNVIEQENELIKLSNETISQQQITANTEVYLDSLRDSIKDREVKIKELQAHLQIKIDKQAELNQRNENLLKDLDVKIKQHDARVDEIAAQIKDLNTCIEEYKRVQADAVIAKEKKDQFEKEFAENQKYAAQLKETDAVVTNREHQVSVREKANRALSTDVQTRLKLVQGLEAKYGGQP